VEKKKKSYKARTGLFGAIDSIEGKELLTDHYYDKVRKLDKKDNLKKYLAQYSNSDVRMKGALAIEKSASKNGHTEVSELKKRHVSEYIKAKASKLLKKKLKAARKEYHSER